MLRNVFDAKIKSTCRDHEKYKKGKAFGIRKHTELNFRSMSVVLLGPGKTCAWRITD